MSSTTSSFGAVTVPFERWRDACLQQTSVKNTESLRTEAQKLFAKLFQTTNVALSSDLLLSTKSSHNEALAKLMKELGPCFAQDGTHVNRVYALSCLRGALEGCEQVSRSIFDLLSAFLLSYSKPLEEEDEDENDTEEIIRDTAIVSLGVLVQITIEDEDDEVVLRRIKLAQEGVENRCASGPSDSEMHIDHGYGSGVAEDVRGGLSLLPRSRRSECFDLLGAAVQGIAKMPVPSNANVCTPALSSFTTFTATCLIGESDPRCLMQMIRILHTLQKAFVPYFASRAEFPVLSIFDAVAPYYPIQFTPPPNDKYGITRHGLEKALMSILSFAEYDVKGEPDSNICLAAGLVLERLLPGMDDGDSLIEDKLEALNDLNIVLGHGKCRILTKGTIRELSNALIATHFEASSGVASGKPGKQYKQLADKCRKLISQTVVALEIEEPLWQVFCVEILQSDASILATSPQSMKGRSTTAYLACLAASGGPKTLQACLATCLPPLFDALKEIQDEDKVMAAAYGVAAFFSSYEVAMSQSIGSVTVHPHPLEPHSTTAAQVLFNIFTKSSNEGVRIASFQAITAMLLVTPPSLIEDVSVVVNFLQDFAVLVGPESNAEEGELKTVVAKSLGAIIGAAEESGARSESVLLVDKTVKECIMDDIYSKFLNTCMHAPSAPAASYSGTAIASACRSNPTIARRTMDEIMTMITEKVKAGSFDQARTISGFCAKILQEGSDVACTAFHDCKVDSIDVIKIVGRASGDANKNPAEKVLKAGMSFLGLPPSPEEVEEENAATELGLALVSNFLPAYDRQLEGEHLKKLLNYMNHILPPLSSWQTVQLCITLPLFAKVLEKSEISDELNTSLPDMVSPLTEMALSVSNSSRVRSDAGSSVFWIIARQPPSSDCMAKHVLETTVRPELQRRLEVLQDPIDEAIKTTKAAAYIDALNLCAMIGSAAACRGSVSTQTSNVVAQYLVKLALVAETSDLFNNGVSVVYASSFAIQTMLQSSSALAFGSMIGINTGRSLWKQRLARIALKELQMMKGSINILNPQFWGQISLVSQVVVWSHLASLSDAETAWLCSKIVSGLLAMFPCNPGSELVALVERSDILGTIESVLGALLKLLASPQRTSLQPIGPLVTVILRILNSGEHMGIRVLALQALYFISTMEDEKAVLVSVGPAVECVLEGCLDHTSSLFRQMVAETRNKWSVVLG